MAYEKLLNEIYAAVSLKYLWPQYQPEFVKCESPDWINETMDLGLEVSQALMPEDGQAAKFIELYLGRRREEIPEASMARYGERLYFYNERFWAILPRDEEEQDYLQKARYRFDSKLLKLNTNYQNRGNNGLYLFLHPREDDTVDAASLFSYMKERQATEKVKFDYVFLNCMKEIYVCNFREDSMEKIILPKNAEDFLNAEAERLRHEKDWENGVAV